MINLIKDMMNYLHIDNSLFLKYLSNNVFNYIIHEIGNRVDKNVYYAIFRQNTNVLNFLGK